MLAHFHTKKSPHCSALSGWGADILDILIGPQGMVGHTVASILQMLQDQACIIFPEGQSQILQDKSGWAGDHAIAAQVLRKYTDMDIEDFPEVSFPQGSMFWAGVSDPPPFMVRIST